MTKGITLWLAVTSWVAAGALHGCNDPIADEAEVDSSAADERTRGENAARDREETESDEEPTSAEVAAAVSDTAEEDGTTETRVADVDPESARFGSVELAPGFMPDPSRLEGRAGGDLRARTWDPQCTGWVMQTPNHVFVAALAFSELHIMAHAPGEEDLTIVVRKPDGTFVCNDDASRRTTDPMVTTEFPSGEYSVWVGAMRENETPAYVLGLSELPNNGPRDLARRD